MLKALSMKSVPLMCSGAVILGLASGPAAAAVYDLSLGFSSANGAPGSPWSYGYTDALLSSFIPLQGYQSFTPTSSGSGSINYWSGLQQVPANLNPDPVWIGLTDTAVPFSFSSISLPAGSVAAHPGQNGEYAIIRFTAPAAGQYAINAAFSQGDSFTQTEVRVMTNGSNVFSSTVNWSVPGSVTAQSMISLGYGDTIDFAVGPNGDYANDTTRIQAQISEVPGPLPVLGALAAFGWSRRLRSRIRSA